MEEDVAAIEAGVPEARGLVGFDPRPLPFPDAIDDTGTDVLGDVVITPLDDAVRQTVDVFRRAIERGELVPELHGLEAAAARA